MPGNPVQPNADPILSSLEIRDRPRLARISFSSLNYQFEELVRFAYRLDDGLWTDSPERSISIAGMGPGRHRLEIRSRVRNGPFSPKITVAEFDVEPMWWGSWWFRAIVILLLALFVQCLVLWRDGLLRQRNASLQRAVCERTAELEAERAKVLEEKQRADEASEAKDLFLANMSHEIRTPLNGLLGLTCLLEETQRPDQSRDTIRLIRSSGKALLRVINDILDFSKVEAGKLDLEIAPFQLRSALQDAVGLFRAIAAEKGLHLGLTLSPDLPAYVAGDEIRLRQVISNLISNGLKFTHLGEIVVSAGVEAQGEAQNETSHLIWIEVRNTGIGIAPDRITHLFSSFSQADSSISRRFGRTGLGLAISKRLVELMGGRIDVQSRPGKGATFRFTIRLCQATAPVPAVDDEEARRDVSKLRVLLAEDNRVNQMVGLKLLQNLGISADLAENGAEAVAAVMRNTYDLVLMNVQIPDVDGIAATREIRTRLAGDRQPFICGLSAHETTKFQELCELAGMDRYRTKPLKFEKLQKLLVERSAQTVV